MPPTLSVDLALPPADRWRGLAPHLAVARALVDSYLRDLGLPGDDAVESWAPLLDAYRAGFVRIDLGEEMDAVAHATQRSPRAVLVANLYYDLVYYGWYSNRSRGARRAAGRARPAGPYPQPEPSPLPSRAS